MPLRTLLVQFCSRISLMSTSLKVVNRLRFAGLPPSVRQSELANDSFSRGGRLDCQWHQWPRLRDSAAGSLGRFGVVGTGMDAASTSALVTRPWAPVPVTLFTSTPASAATLAAMLVGRGVSSAAAAVAASTTLAGPESPGSAA